MGTQDSKRLAIVIMNLGGPDQLDAVEPFLNNLFRDPAILRVPNFIRPSLAVFLSKYRAPIARQIYTEVGGSSPLIKETQAQADALEQYLRSAAWPLDLSFEEVKVFISMRYWRPFPHESVSEVARFAPDHVVLLPLFPQYSTTTTQTSLKAWYEAADRQGFTVPISHVCCFPTQKDFVTAHVQVISDLLNSQEWSAPVHIAFSAHSLPQKIVDQGDPYPRQVQASVEAIIAQLGRKDVEFSISYQSRLGPVKWLEPRLRETIGDVGRQGKSMLVVPIAFVSEHVETLVELDQEMRDVALEAGVVDYARSPSLGVHLSFIEALSQVAEAVLRGEYQECHGGHDHFRVS